MKISEKRKAGKLLGRGGIASRIIALAQDISEGTYKNAIEKAGNIYELSETILYDEYWSEKLLKGRMQEKVILTDLLSGDIDRDKAAHNINPYDA